ncbi:hypothetical protein V8C86DRAFT_2660151 [Haematococcus lacustris]
MFDVRVYLALSCFSPRLLMTALKRTVMATMVFLRHRGVMPFTFLAPLCPGHAAYGAEPVAHLWSVYVFLLPWICRL